MGITFLESLKRIRKVRKVLIQHPEGLCQKDLANHVGLGRPNLSSLIYRFLAEKLSTTRIGQYKIFKLVDKTPSIKEKRLIIRSRTFKKAKQLRRDGFSYSEIERALKKEFGINTDKELIKNIKMSKNGLLRYQTKMKENWYKAGLKGGIAAVISGRIYKIQDARMKGFLKKTISRIPKSSRRLTLPKVRIISHCLFDGFVTYNPVKSRYVVGYCNSSKRLLKQFILDMKKVYRLEPTDIIIRERNNYIVRYCCKAIVKDLIRYTKYSSGERGAIPKEILNPNNIKFQVEFLRCFWDDEGMVGFSARKDKKGYVHMHRFVEAFQKNIKLLNQIKDLQEKLGVKARISNNKIKVSNKENLKKFAKTINFSNNAKVVRTTSKWFGVRKRDLLKFAIDSYDK